MAPSRQDNTRARQVSGTNPKHLHASRNDFTVETITVCAATVFVVVVVINGLLLTFLPYLRLVTSINAVTYCNIFLLFFLILKELIRIKRIARVLQNAVPVHLENSAKKLVTRYGQKNVKLVIYAMAVPTHLLQVMG